MTMNKTNYKQYDTRWAKLGYPKSPYFIKNCGCGEVAICNVIIEMDKYKNQTPKTIQSYCKQFAAPNGNGTYFSGIPTMMKHYGLTEVKEHSTMNQLWKELAKGNRVAIYLMGNRKGGSKGVKWSGSAHFVCSTGYKVENGKHYVYVKDSNSTSSLRNGWITYEENMRNDVSRVWSGKLNGTLYKATSTTTTTTTSGKLTVDGIGGAATVTALQKFLGVTQTGGITIRKDLHKYCPALTSYEYGNGSPTVTAMQKWLGLSNPDGLWGSNTSKALQLKVGFAKSECDGIFGPNSMKALQKYLNSNDKAVYPTVKQTSGDKIGAKANEYAYTTNTSKAAYKGGSPTAAYTKGLATAYPDRSSWGTAPKKGASCDVFVGTCVRNAGIDKDFPRGLDEQIKYLAKSSKFSLVSVTTSTVKNGDIIVYSKTSGGGHICIAYGGKTKEAGYQNYYPKTTSTLSSRLSKSGKKWLKVYRAK